MKKFIIFVWLLSTTAIISVNTQCPKPADNDPNFIKEEGCSGKREITDKNTGQKKMCNCKCTNAKNGSAGFYCPADSSTATTSMPGCSRPASNDPNFIPEENCKGKFKEVEDKNTGKMKRCNCRCINAINGSSGYYCPADDPKTTSQITSTTTAGMTSSRPENNCPKPKANDPNFTPKNKCAGSYILKKDILTGKTTKCKCRCSNTSNGSSGYYCPGWSPAPAGKR